MSKAWAFMHYAVIQHYEANDRDDFVIATFDDLDDAREFERYYNERYYFKTAVVGLTETTPVDIEFGPKPDA